MTTPPTTRSVEDRLIQFGPESRQRWLPLFAAAGVPYPPARLVLAAFKSERLLAVHAAGPTGPLRLVRTCPILGASGVIGPKLREGDRQVPEGVYRIALLNPNSKYQVSLRIDYPNDFDRATAAADGRTDLGGDIMIHGGNTSAGCLAMGDETSADLFILAADTGIDRITVLLCPVDFRHRDLPPDRPPAPPWIHTVYADLRARLRELQP